MKKHRPSQALTLITKPLTFMALRGSLRTRVIVRHGDEILLARGRLGSQHWSLPGGGVKKGESLVQGAKREIREELNITLRDDDLRLLSEDRFQKSRHLHLFYAAFEATVPNRSFSRNTRELLAAEWFPLTALPADVSALSRQILTNYLAEK